jgi:FtsH-binding integral membrane protein
MSKTKEPWDKRVGSMVEKVGRVLRSIWDILYKIIQQAIETINYLVTLITKLLINPTATIVFWIGALALVTILTAVQWWQIGVWIGQILRTPQFLGWSLGTVGMMGGLFLNIEELSPELHKIHENLARAYDKMGVKLDHTPEPDNIKDRLANWFSYDMSLAKKGRLFSYAVEAALVLSFVFLTGLTLQAIALAVISLVLPEVVIKCLSSKTSLFGTASALANQIESEGSGRNFGGSSAPKGAKAGFDPSFPGGEGGRKDKF